jgi:UDP-glucose 4-epimerase
MHILVTGGAGYIGSHTIVELLNAGHTVTAIDNLSNSSPEAIRRVEEITGKRVPFVDCDIRDREGLERVFAENRFDCCIHFAGLKAVGESVVKPWEYYENNVNGTLVLVDVMRKHGCKNIIFSSSATVYGAEAPVPYTESTPKGRPTNPYGMTKSMLEDILSDLAAADVKTGDPNPWNVVILRYFNPIGAHPSGRIGEDPNGIPNNLMPYITQVAAGKLEKLHVFGNDYDTPDGTGVRDYIHVVDLAKGHVLALKAVERNCGVAVYNLGTGKGYSVLDIVKAFEEANGLKIPYVIDPRRPGDLDAYWADAAKAEKELGWTAENGIFEMCRDSWNWQKNNPNGYEE